MTHSPLLWADQEPNGDFAQPQDLGVLFPHDLQAGVSLTANLGPGLDVMAAALALDLDLEVEETGSFGVETELDVPRDRSNLIVRSFERLHPADGFQFRISSEIPLTGGLGSSAAAIVAGLLAADHLFELDADVRAHAVALEGHPDNVCAALYGGLVICDGDGAHRG